MKRARKNLATVDPLGRLDVLLYRLLVASMERIERDHGLTGLRENVAPIFEDWIVAHVPAQKLIPREIEAVLRVCELNRGKVTS